MYNSSLDIYKSLIVDKRLQYTEEEDKRKQSFYINSVKALGVAGLFLLTPIGNNIRIKFNDIVYDLFTSQRNKYLIAMSESLIKERPIEMNPKYVNTSKVYNANKYSAAYDKVLNNDINRYVRTKAKLLSDVVVRTHKYLDNSSKVSQEKPDVDFSDVYYQYELYKYGDKAEREQSKYHARFMELTTKMSSLELIYLKGQKQVRIEGGKQQISQYDESKWTNIFIDKKSQETFSELIDVLVSKSKIASKKFSNPLTDGDNLKTRNNVVFVRTEVGNKKISFPIWSYDVGTKGTVSGKNVSLAFSEWYKNKFIPIMNEMFDDNGNLKDIYTNEDLLDKLTDEIAVVKSTAYGLKEVEVTDTDIDNYVNAMVGLYKKQSLYIGYGGSGVDIPFMLNSPFDINKGRGYKFRGVKRVDVGRNVGNNGVNFYKNAVKSYVKTDASAIKKGFEVTTFSDRFNQLMLRFVNDIKDFNKGSNTDILRRKNRIFNNLISSLGMVVENVVTLMNNEFGIYKLPEQINISKTFNSSSIQDQLVQLHMIKKALTNSGNRVDLYLYGSINKMISFLENSQKYMDKSDNITQEEYENMFMSIVDMQGMVLQASNRQLTGFTTIRGRYEYFVGINPGEKPPGIKTQAYSRGYKRYGNRTLFNIDKPAQISNPADLRGYAFLFLHDPNDIISYVGEGQIGLTDIGYKAIRRERPYYNNNVSITLDENEMNTFKNLFIDGSNTDNRKYNTKLLNFVNKKVSKTKQNFKMYNITSIDSIEQDGNNYRVNISGETSISKQYIRIGKMYTSVTNTIPVVKLNDKPGMNEAGYLLDSAHRKSIFVPTRGRLLYTENDEVNIKKIEINEGLGVVNRKTFSFTPKYNKQFKPLAFINDKVRYPMMTATGIINSIFTTALAKNGIDISTIGNDILDAYKNIWGEILGLNKNDVNAIINRAEIVPNSLNEASFQLIYNPDVDVNVLENEFNLGLRSSKFINALTATLLSKDPKSGMLEDIVKKINAAMKIKNPKFKELTVDDIVDYIKPDEIQNKQGNKIKTIYKLPDRFKVFSITADKQVLVLADAAYPITTEEKKPIYSTQTSDSWTRSKPSFLKGASINQYTMMVASIVAPNYYSYLAKHVADNTLYSKHLQENAMILVAEHSNIVNNKDKVIIHNVEKSIKNADDVISDIFDQMAKINKKIVVKAARKISFSKRNRINKEELVNDIKSMYNSEKIKKMGNEFLNSLTDKISKIATLNTSDDMSDMILKEVNKSILEFNKDNNAFLLAYQKLLSENKFKTNEVVLDLRDFIINTKSNEVRKVALVAGMNMFSGFVGVVPAYQGKVLTKIENKSTNEIYHKLSPLYEDQLKLIMLINARNKFVRENKNNQNDLIIVQIDNAIESCLRSFAKQFTTELTSKTGMIGGAFKVYSNSSSLPFTQFVEPYGYAASKIKAVKKDQVETLQKIISNEFGKSIPTEMQNDVLVLLNKILKYVNGDESMTSSDLDFSDSDKAAKFIVSVLHNKAEEFRKMNSPLPKMIEQTLVRKMMYDPTAVAYISRNAISNMMKTYFKSSGHARNMSKVESELFLRNSEVIIDAYVNRITNGDGVLGVLSREPVHTIKAMDVMNIVVTDTHRKSIEAVQLSDSAADLFRADKDSDTINVFLPTIETFNSFISKDKYANILSTHEELTPEMVESIVSDYVKAHGRSGLNKDMLFDYIRSRMRKSLILTDKNKKDTIKFVSPLMKHYFRNYSNNINDLNTVSLRDFVKDVIHKFYGEDIDSTDFTDDKIDDMIKTIASEIDPSGEYFANDVNDAKIVVGIMKNKKTEHDIEKISSEMKNKILLELGFNPVEFKDTNPKLNQLYENITKYASGVLSSANFQAFTNTKFLPPKTTIPLIIRTLIATDSINKQSVTFDKLQIFYDILNNTTIDSKHGYIHFTDGIFKKLKEIGSLANLTDKRGQPVEDIMKAYNDLVNGDYEVSVLQSNKNIKSNFNSAVIKYIGKNNISNGDKLTLNDMILFYQKALYNMMETEKESLDLDGININKKDAVKMLFSLGSIKKKIGDALDGVKFDNANEFIAKIEKDPFMASLIEVEQIYKNNTDLIRITNAVQRGLKITDSETLYKYLSNILNINQGDIHGKKRTITDINSAVANKIITGIDDSLYDDYKNSKGVLRNKDLDIPLLKGGIATIGGVLLATGIMSLLNKGIFNPGTTINNNSNINFFTNGLSDENNLYTYKSRVQLVHPHTEYRLYKSKMYDKEKDEKFINKTANIYP